MRALHAVYLDFQDRHSYRAWRWLSLLPQRASVEVRPYLLDAEDGAPCSPWDRTEPTWALDLLALGELARDTGPGQLLAYVDAAFDTIHGSGQDPSSPEAFLELASTVGLELDRFAADSERWRAEVGLWHREAEDELGVTAVPCLVFDDGTTLLVRLGAEVPDSAAARRLLADLADLAEQPVVEVRRTT